MPTLKRIRGGNKWLRLPTICGAISATLILLVYLIWSMNTFRFSGVIVDEEGRPVDDALLAVLRGWSRKMGFETDYEHSIIRVDSSFSTSVWGADSVDLSFTAQSYDLVTLRFSRPGAYYGLRIVMKRK